ncbi:transporter [Solimonas flava]|uniref:transporter n=1 Tax=Solimonas flava TaxID=415849 RepID=UPI0004021F1B|nr:transporter [Solimonas flava]
MPFSSRAARGLTLAGRSLAALAGLYAGHAAADTTFDVIGPREYELPVDFQPFNVFVQYAMVQNDDRAFDADGDRVDGSGLERLVGMSKYVRFWTPGFDRRIGLAWEVIVPEVSIRDRAAASADERQASGLGDPLTGFAVWFKPGEGATLGFQSFLQMPVGSDEVSDSNWKNLSSLFWDLRLPARLGWTADAGFVYQSRRTHDRVRPGLNWHTNQRFAWRATELFEPYLALDAEYSDGRDGLASGWVVDAGPGLMLHTFENQSLSLRYSTSLGGRNHVVNNSANLKYAYAW